MHRPRGRSPTRVEVEGLALLKAIEDPVEVAGSGEERGGAESVLRYPLDVEASRALLARHGLDKVPLDAEWQVPLPFAQTQARDLLEGRGSARTHRCEKNVPRLSRWCALWPVSRSKRSIRAAEISAVPNWRMSLW